MTTTMKLSLKNSKLSIRNSQHYHSQPEQEKEDSMIFGELSFYCAKYEIKKFSLYKGESICL